MTDELPRIASVAIAGDRTLSVVWRGGVRSVVHLTGWIRGGQFSQLERPEIFGTAAVVDHGPAVQWNGDEDLAIDAAHLCLLANQASGEIERLRYDCAEAYQVVGNWPRLPISSGISQ